MASCLGIFHDNPNARYEFWMRILIWIRLILPWALFDIFWDEPMPPHRRDAAANRYLARAIPAGTGNPRRRARDVSRSAPTCLANGALRMSRLPF